MWLVKATIHILLNVPSIGVCVSTGPLNYLRWLVHTRRTTTICGLLKSIINLVSLLGVTRLFYLQSQHNKNLPAIYSPLLILCKTVLKDLQNSKLTVNDKNNELPSVAGLRSLPNQLLHYYYSTIQATNGTGRRTLLHIAQQRGRVEHGRIIQTKTTNHIVVAFSLWPVINCGASTWKQTRHMLLQDKLTKASFVALHALLHAQNFMTNKWEQARLRPPPQTTNKNNSVREKCQTWTTGRQCRRRNAILRCRSLNDSLRISWNAGKLTKLYLINANKPVLAHPFQLW